MMERFTVKTISVGLTADMGLFASMDRIAIMMENCSGGVCYFGNRDVTPQSGYPLGPSGIAMGAQEAMGISSGAGRVHLAERTGDVVTPEYWFITLGTSKEVRVWEAYST